MKLTLNRFWDGIINIIPQKWIPFVLKMYLKWDFVVKFAKKCVM